MARGPHSSEIMASQGLFFFFYEETSLKGPFSIFQHTLKSCIFQWYN